LAVKKVLLIGPGGAGKSTLATTLAQKTGLPLVHLDSLYWQPGWVPTSPEEWRRCVARLAEEDSWIMDGNFGGTLEMRLAAADTIVLMDLSPWVCVWRLLKRRVNFHGRSRPDMRAGCNERLDAAFLWWVLSYRSRRLPALLLRLKQAELAGKQVYVLRTSKEVADFIEHTCDSAR